MVVCWLSNPEQWLKISKEAGNMDYNGCSVDRVNVTFCSHDSACLRMGYRPIPPWQRRSLLLLAVTWPKVTKAVFSFLHLTGVIKQRRRRANAERLTSITVLVGQCRRQIRQFHGLSLSTVKNIFKRHAAWRGFSAILSLLYRILHAV